MNQRIEKLIEQCQWETYGVNGELLESGFAAEKFAESLVRECIAKVSEWDMGIDDPVGATDNTSVVSRDIVAEIKQHFGVEE